jgi:CspA family cold shock protein
MYVALVENQVFGFALLRRPDLGAYQVTPKTRTFRSHEHLCASQLEAACNARNAIMATGTVKFFNTQKGFGFITPSDGSRDVFVHISAVERAGMSTLNEGQRLTYEVVTERGKQAASNLQNA